MITLTTGQPGAGKTLLTLWRVREQAQAEGREVYYSGIADLKIPGWIELERGEDWHKVPANSIVVIDEAQRVFRPRGVGSSVPDHVAKLETHRHAGVDVFVITQHPKLLDANVRRLVGRHLHVMRAFGTSAAVVHEWGETRPDPDLSRADSITSTVAYPREAFGWYRSAEAHTHKRRIPARVWLIFASPVLLAGAGYGIYLMIAGQLAGESATMTGAKERVGAGAASSSSAAQAAAAGRGGEPVLTAAEYVARHEPRVQGLAHTAPVYDGVTQVAEAPEPVACVASRTRCQCYSQQATRLPVSDDLCRRIVADGWFRAFARKAEGPPKADEKKGPSASVQAPGARVVPAGYPGRPPGPDRVLEGEARSAGLPTAPR